MKSVLKCTVIKSIKIKIYMILDNIEAQQNIFKTQQHINSYARQGLRVLVMAKRMLTESEYADWLKTHKEVELCHENREKKLIDSYSSIETKLTLLGKKLNIIFIINNILKYYIRY